MPEKATIGQFEQTVLAAVASQRDNAYGISIHAAAAELASPKAVSLGAVYATLDRLEAKGLLDSRRVHGEGPSRRQFELTRSGARALAETRAMREQLWSGVDLRRLLGLARA